MHSTVACLCDVKVPLMLERAELTLWQALIEGQHHPHLQHSTAGAASVKQVQLPIAHLDSCCKVPPVLLRRYALPAWGITPEHAAGVSQEATGSFDYACTPTSLRAAAAWGGWTHLVPLQMAGSSEAQNHIPEASHLHPASSQVSACQDRGLYSAQNFISLHKC